MMNIKPDIKNFPPFKAIGMKYSGKNENNEIVVLWDKFIPRMSEIKNVSERGNSFGVYSPIGETDYEKQFDYIACLEVNEIEDIPNNMVSVEIPEGKYAVFTHRGSVKNMMEMDDYIFKKWMKETELKVDEDRYDFELYNENFKGEADDSEIYFYIPIK
ncbi:hypothetical protein BH10BAC5_BH10BAC5_28750 [soil metagenome]